MRLPRRTCIAGALYILFPLFIWGQADTTYLLDKVEIAAPRLRNANTGGRSETWNMDRLKQRKTQNVATLLNEESGAFIKSYGLGSLATTSIRGGSAGHTVVLWNGLPVHSPMLGQLDVSLLPLGFADEVSVQYGGGTAMWGSGAIGGTISLDNRPRFAKQVSLESQSMLGSFGHVQQQIQIKAGNKKVSSVTRLMHQQAKNNFSYSIRPDLPLRQQTNAALRQQGVMQSLHYKIDQKQQLAIHAWHQYTDREIPPTMVQRQSEATQKDWATRVIAHYKRLNLRSMTQARAGWFHETLDYADPAIGLTSLSRFTTYIAEVDHQINWNDQYRLYVGSTHSYTSAHSGGYQEVPTEYRGALFASFRAQTGKWLTQMSIRQEMVDGRRVPLVPVLGVEKRLNKTFLLKGEISRNYRLPTLNDRFWSPGGNPDLLPESGWSEELGLEAQTTKKTWRLRASLTGFNRNIDNWMLWSRKDGQSFWSANNIAKVWSRGLEQTTHLTYQHRQLTADVKIGYSYTRSTNQIGIQNPRIEKGQQLWYVPVHQVKGTFSIQHKNLYAAYQHQLSGSYQGINESLPSYHVGNVRIRYEGKLAFLSGAISLSIHNAWNASYVVVERFPMPGRAFQIGIHILTQT